MWIALQYNQYMYVIMDIIHHRQQERSVKQKRNGNSNCKLDTNKGTPPSKHKRLTHIQHVRYEETINHMHGCKHTHKTNTHNKNTNKQTKNK